MSTWKSDCPLSWGLLARDVANPRLLIHHFWRAVLRFAVYGVFGTTSSCGPFDLMERDRQINSLLVLVSGSKYLQFQRADEFVFQYSMASLVSTIRVEISYLLRRAARSFCSTRRCHAFSEIVLGPRFWSGASREHRIRSCSRHRLNRR